jgi:hypothetical protein
MYTGNERLIIAGKELKYSMLNFWQTSYSDILLNMNRGTFAEFIVRCALNGKGLPTFDKTMTGVEPYDMEGPEIISKAGARPCRIEVKCSAYVQHWSKPRTYLDKPDSKISFSISPAYDFFYEAEKGVGRHNDLYVFAFYNAHYRECNMLNLDFWDFYVFPTYRIDSDPSLSSQKTISLGRIKHMQLEKIGFNDLAKAIYACADDISKHYEILDRK